MSSEKKERRLRSLLRLIAVLVVPPALALLVRAQTQDHARPVPATYDTLARFLPADASVVKVEPSSTRGLFRFEAATTEQAYSGEVTAQGTLLWLASPADLGSIPVNLRESLLRGSSLEQQRLERVQLMAFAVETKQRDGSEHARLLDALGNRVFEVTAGSEWKDDDGVEGLEHLPAPVARALRLHVGEMAPTRLQRGVELGARVYAATWRSGHGEQEVNILDDGLTLSLELPKDEPVPPVVLRQVAPDAQVRALILETYWLSDHNGVVVRALLPNGVEISPPTRHSSVETSEGLLAVEGGSGSL